MRRGARYTSWLCGVLQRDVQLSTTTWCRQPALSNMQMMPSHAPDAVGMIALLGPSSSWFGIGLNSMASRSMVSAVQHGDRRNAGHAAPYGAVMMGMAVIGGLGFWMAAPPSITARCTSPIQAGAFNPSLKTYTKEEVSKHNSKESGVWVTYKDGVYDLQKKGKTPWMEIHPGGADKVMLAAGGPIDPFWAMYAQHNTDQVKEILEEYRIGNLEGGAAPVQDPYEKEPTDRHPSLSIRSKQPMNAETPMELLAESIITPREIFYIRNHLPVPEMDETSFAVEVGGDGVKNLKLNLEDLKTKFKKHTVIATVQCAGNRRKELLDCTFVFVDNDDAAVFYVS